MSGIFKAIMWISLIIMAIILPAYIWSILDRQSYENFLLKSVSPLSQKSRNSILQKKNKSSLQDYKKTLK